MSCRRFPASATEERYALLEHRADLHADVWYAADEARQHELVPVSHTRAERPLVQHARDLLEPRDNVVHRRTLCGVVLGHGRDERLHEVEAALGL